MHKTCCKYVLFLIFFHFLSQLIITHECFPPPQIPRSNFRNFMWGLPPYQRVRERGEEKRVESRKDRWEKTQEKGGQTSSVCPSGCRVGEGGRRGMMGSEVRCPCWVMFCGWKNSAVVKEIRTVAGGLFSERLQVLRCKELEVVRWSCFCVTLKHLLAMQGFWLVKTWGQIIREAIKATPPVSTDQSVTRRSNYQTLPIWSNMCTMCALCKCRPKNIYKFKTHVKQCILADMPQLN